MTTLERKKVPLFHFLPGERQPGEIVQPGNFGRLLRTHEGLPAFGRVMVTGMLCREMLWETIRLRKFGNLPPRLDCVFLLPHRIDADAYDKLRNVDGRQVLHEVEIVDARSPTHVAWLSHCPMQSGGSFLEQMEAKGMAYWSGEPGDQSQGRELLVKSNVRIVRRI
jgi:hypothetical protein